jgi:type VI secretion system protein ImpH
MASPRGTARDSVKGLLEREPTRFSFVQVIRILELIRRRVGIPYQPIGRNARPDVELVRLVGKAGLSFPSSEVVSLANLSARDPANDPLQPVLQVAFLGLYGASGVLPYFDTQRIIDQGIRSNPEKDLLDLFNHRILSYFFRASTKYRIPVAYEHYLNDCESASRNSSGSTSTDHVVTKALLAFAGMATPGLARRMDFPDDLTIEFSQFFGNRPKNAISLTRMLEAVFQQKVQLIQFQGQWLQLSPDNKSLMPTREMPMGQNSILGQAFIIGDRVWDIQSKFRIRLGPLNLNDFQSYLPGSSNLTKMAQLVRLYVGNQMDFDVQLELVGAEVPDIKLGAAASRLGLNTWLISKPPTSNKSEAVFKPSGQPSR